MTADNTPTSFPADTRLMGLGLILREWTADDRHVIRTARHTLVGSNPSPPESGTKAGSQAGAWEAASWATFMPWASA